jgi:hypothetical protein
VALHYATGFTERANVSFWARCGTSRTAAVIYDNDPGNSFGTMDPNTSTIAAISLSPEDGIAILGSSHIGRSARRKVHA